MNRARRALPAFFACLLVAGAVISCVDDQGPHTGQLPLPSLAPPSGVEALFGSLKPPAVTSLVEAYEQAGTTGALVRRQDITQTGNGYFGANSVTYTSTDCVLYMDSLYGAGKLLELGFKGTRYTGGCNTNWPNTGRVTQRIYDVKGALVPFAVGNEASFKFDATANGGDAAGIDIAIEVVAKLDRFEGAGVSVDGPIWVLQRNKRINILYSEKLGVRLLEAVDGESVYEVLNVTPRPEAARYVRNKMDFTDARSFQVAAAAWLKTEAPGTILTNTREMMTSARRAEAQARTAKGESEGGGFNAFLGIMAAAMTGARNPGDVAHNLQRMTLESQLDLPPGSLQTATPGYAATAGGMTPMTAGRGGSGANAQQIAAACSAQCAAPTRACQTNANGAGNQVDCYRAASCECSCFLAHDPGNPNAASWRQCVASNNASAAGLSSNAPHYGIR